MQWILIEFLMKIKKKKKLLTMNKTKILLKKLITTITSIKINSNLHNNNSRISHNSNHKESQILL